MAAPTVAFSGLAIHNSGRQDVLPHDQVREIAKENDCREVQHRQNSRVISFIRQSVKIKVYYTTGTVGTCLNHPKKGKTQMFRRNDTIDSLQAIFDNPRVRTGSGYFRKNRNQKWQAACGDELDSVRR